MIFIPEFRAMMKKIISVTRMVLLSHMGNGRVNYMTSGKDMKNKNLLIIH